MAARRGGVGGRSSFPESVQGIIAARVDALDAGGEAAAPGRRRHRQGLLVGRPRGDRRTRPLRARGAAATAGAARVRPPRAAQLGGGRDRVRVPARALARRRLRHDPACCAREQAPRCRRVDRVARPSRTTTPTCSRTTTSRRSSSHARPGSTRPVRGTAAARCSERPTARSRSTRSRPPRECTRRRSRSGSRTRTACAPCSGAGLH